MRTAFSVITITLILSTFLSAQTSELQNMLSEEAMRILEASDIDSDGRLTKEEFRNHIEKSWFSRIDENSNSKIDIQEFRKAFLYSVNIGNTWTANPKNLYSEYVKLRNSSDVKTVTIETLKGNRLWVAMTSDTASSHWQQITRLNLNLDRQGLIKYLFEVKPDLLKPPSKVEDKLERLGNPSSSNGRYNILDFG